MKYNAKSLGKKIRHLRNFVGLTQTEVAQAIGISQPLYAQIENGKRNITEDNMKKICEFYSITEHDLIHRQKKTLYNKIWVTVKQSKQIRVTHTDLQGNTYTLTLN